MRGKHKIRGADSNQVRNIPAYAGKTFPRSSSWNSQPEHPRVCGENRRSRPRLERDSGTSPRMRGKRLKRAEGVLFDGNIPAYAGKTHGVCVNVWRRREHPRVCGENHAANFGRAHGARNIPAYAGKTLAKISSAGRSEEHPRVCGENTVVDYCYAGRRGTSPRMRGKRILPMVADTTRRNIPAYAGKTWLL